MIRNIISRLYQNFLRIKFSGALKQYKDCHRNERCFVLGNGPSLTPEDLDKLCQEYSFGCNRIFTLFDKTKWRPSYYVIHDDSVVLENLKYLKQVSQECKTAFLLGDTYRAYPAELKRMPNVVFYRSYTDTGENYNAPVSEDITKGINNGFTVTFAMLQIAFYMGFQEIYLLGVDNNFSRMYDREGNLIIQDVKDHFEGGDHPKISNCGTSPWVLEQTYLSAKKYAEAHGIKIYNSTRGGKLEVFERKDLDQVLKEGNNRC